jgi:protein gp37
MAQAGRFSGPGQPYEGLVRKTSQGFKWTGEVRLIEKDLEVPLRWKKPKKIFVNSMSDLFHEHVPDAWIDRLFAVMAQAQVYGHVFQILTKRAERMHAYMTAAMPRVAGLLEPELGFFPAGIVWPIRNIWLGVSVENQAALNRLTSLCETPAAVRFASFEPLLEDLGDITPWLEPVLNAGGLDWCIAGGESGPKARSCDMAWLRSIKDQCAMAGIAFFCKQLGKQCRTSRHDAADACCYGAGWTAETPGSAIGIVSFVDRKGANPDEWPADLRVQQFPEVPHARP